jgi:toxin ParE1/3/4
MPELFYSLEATSDLDEISRFSIERFGLPTARTYVDGLRDIIAWLATMPEVGAVVAGINPRMLSYAYQRHRIYYRFDRSTVTIVRILHQAMDANRRLND